MIVFKNVRWKNFLSTGNVFTEISLNNDKTTLIVGENGAGKSTLLDAICYVLYNKPFRKINKPQLMNTINKKDMIVEIEFNTGSHQYKVRRGMRPAVFEIYQNDVMINQDAAARDYQEVLEKQILKLNYRSFCQVDILGSASFVPFMQLPTGHRREIIEDILDIKIFSIMNILLKEKINNNTSLSKDCDYELKLTREKINLQEKYQDSLKRNDELQINNLLDKIKEYNSNIEKENNSIMENNRKKEYILTDVVEPTKISNRLAKVNILHSQLKSKIEKLHSDVSFFHDHNTCPTCKQIIDEEFKKENIDIKKSQINETENAVDLLIKEIDNTQSRLEEVNKIYQECSNLNVQNSVSKNSIASYEKLIKSAYAEIEKINNKPVDSTNFIDLESLEINLEKISTKKKKLLEEKEVYSIAASMLKDSGIKSKIIKQYIPIINKFINKYLAAMDFFISFELDETFNETIKSRFRDEFSYSSFSEGEKSRINLAILFTWRAIAKLRNSANTNLLIFDEIFDGSLDGAGTEEFMKILNTIAPDSNIFVISHKTDVMQDKFDNVIRFEKVKNFSQIAIDN